MEWLRRVANKLGPLVEDVVFVGGLAGDLLITDQGAHDARFTEDVDMVIECTSRTKYLEIEKQLRNLGLKHDLNGPTCRFLFDDITLDVMPSEESVLGFSNQWYPQVLRKNNPVSLGEGLIIRLVDAPTFLCTKIDAFLDRGKDDFQTSSDIEDIVLVIDGRPELFLEIFKSNTDTRVYLSEKLSQFLENDDFIDVLPTLVVGDRHRILEQRLQAIVGMAANVDWSISFPETTLPKYYKLLSVPVSKTKKFSVDQHKAIAQDVAESKDRLVSLSVNVGNCYPGQSVINKKLFKIEKAFSEFKSVLDDEYCAVEQSTPPFPYYPPQPRDKTPWHTYADLELAAFHEYLNLIGQEIRKSYGVNSRPTKSLSKLLDAFSQLRDEMKLGYPAKKSRHFELQKLLSPDLYASVGTYSVVKTEKSKRGGNRWNSLRDFSSHSCDRCKPLSIDERGHETLPAYAQFKKRKAGSFYQLYVWCRYCWKFHLHGGGSAPLETKAGSRVPHCLPGPWRYEKQYVLEVVGTYTPEIENTHNPDLRYRTRFLKRLGLIEH